MSALTDFLTQPGFWWGVIVAGTIGPLITARSVRASDKRKADHEDRMDTRKAERENRQSNQKIIRETATTFSEVCSAVIEKAVDSRAVFNATRDAAVTAEGLPDPKEVEKIEFAIDLMDETRKLTTAYNNLRVVAPIALLQKATSLNAALITLTKTTTMPLQRPPLMQAAARAFDDFTNALRAELDLDAYTEEDAGRAATAYVDALKNQVDDYINEARAESRRLGFLEPGSVQGAATGTVEVREPGAVEIVSVKAGDLTQSHVGKFVGCHDPELGFNYGAKILEVQRDDESANPGMLLRLAHPPMPGARAARREGVRLPFDHDVELVDLPSE